VEFRQHRQHSRVETLISPDHTLTTLRHMRAMDLSRGKSPLPQWHLRCASSRRRPFFRTPPRHPTCKDASLSWNTVQPFSGSNRIVPGPGHRRPLDLPPSDASVLTIKSATSTSHQRNSVPAAVRFRSALSSKSQAGDTGISRTHIRPRGIEPREVRPDPVTADVQHPLHARCSNTESFQRGWLRPVQGNTVAISIS